MSSPGDPAAAQQLLEFCMDLAIAGLRVLVTAGAGGIGLAIARAFVAEGARVHICDVDEMALSELAASDGAITRTYCDVSDRTAVKTLFADVVDKLGGLDVLVNNAGVAGPTAKIEDMNPEDWDRCLEVCLTGQFNCTRLAVPLLRNSSNASIVNISSAAGRVGFAMRTPYAAAKWGVIGFTKSLSIELGPDNIRVNAILPGLVAGDRQRRVLEAKAQQRGISYAEMERTAFSYTSIKDYVTPEQIADQIVFMCSPRGKTISGQAISICGDTQMLG
jgi:NAD(P)-dependent dehydrogenase (short-subunit alcohol dehydrogenase family)